MKLRKRIIAIFLSCVMSLGTCVVSLAEEPTMTDNTELAEEAEQLEDMELPKEGEDAEFATDVTATDSDAMDEELETMEIDAALSYFDVPYISTYYFNPKPTINDTIKIPLYITDSEQSEYLKNDTSKKLDLIYEVDGVTKTIKDLPLGDYTLTIGKLSEGMHSFSVQVLDNSTGMKSHKLSNDLWVVNPSKDAISESETYYMTSADLSTYKIKNNNSKNATDMLNTRNGLNQLFVDKQAAGYRKIVLLKGTYRINGEKINRTPGNTDNFYITIPSHFTVDMNGSTFKLDTISVDKDSSTMAIGCLVRLDDAIDTHITNGTLEGDRFERAELGLETEQASKDAKGEAINTLLFAGGKYCTATNLTIKNTTGHAVGSGNVMGPYAMIPEYTKTAIFDGVERANDSCNTSPMMDISKMLNWAKYDGYIYVAHMLGYKGIQGDSPIEYVSFYDANQKYIETITAYQYRRIKVPAGAKYLRVTLLGTIDNNSDKGAHTISVYTQHMGDYYEFSDINFVDTRTTSIAASCGNNVLMENNTYTRCGNSITPAAVDFEEGGEECQDYYYRNNKVIERAGNVTLVDCAGLNHVYENNLGHKMLVKARVAGLVLRNTNDSDSNLDFYIGQKKTSAFARIYNNKCGFIKFSSGEGSKCTDLKVKDCTLRCGNAVERIDGVPDKVTYENCIFPNFAGSKAVFRNCTIQPADQMTSDLKFYDCTFKVIEGSATSLNLNLTYNVSRLFDHCTFEGKTTLSSGGYNVGFTLGTFKNCEFDDLSISLREEANMTPTVFENCIINTSADKFINIGQSTQAVDVVDLQMKGCTITQTGTGNFIYFTGKPNGDSQILFDGCTINKTGGKLIKWEQAYLPTYKDEVSIDIIFKSTTVDKTLEIDNSVDSSHARVSFTDATVSKKNGLLTENGKIYYYINDVKQTGWQQINSKWYYFGTDGAAKTGLQTISNKKYYFNTSGVMQTGWQTISSKKYYFGTDGAMLTGWQTIDSKKYYLGTDGVMVTGTVTIDGKTYLFDSNGVFVKEVVQESSKKNGLLTENGKTYYYVDDVKQTGWQQVNGKKYYFDSNGVMQTGMQMISGRKYYLGTDGVMRTGWQTVDGKTYNFGTDGAAKLSFQVIDGNAYYFGGDGVMVTGMQVISGRTYYYNSNGVKQIGWQTIGGKKYNFGSDGVMLTGWQTIGGKKYYLGTDGVMVTGIVTIDGKKYQFGSDGVFVKEIVQEQATKKNGFVEENGKTYYYVDDAKQIGWQTIEDKKYYFDDEGAMVTDWSKIDSKWYYFDESGVMATDWLKNGSAWYYMGENGVMTKGWLQYGGDWYYLKADGTMAKGWVSYKDAWYYFKADGTMATGWVSYKDNWYFFKADGTMATGWVKSGNKWYYMNEDGEQVTGWVKYNSKWYYMNPDKDGAMTTGWIQYKNNWYYFDADGVMVTGKQVINGKTYNFNSSGVWVN